MWDLRSKEPSSDPSSDICFPKPFFYLRLREQWLFYGGSRTFWLPSEYMVADGFPVALRDGVLFCLGRICCTFDVSESLRYLPSLAPIHAEQPHRPTVWAVSVTNLQAAAWISDSEFDSDPESQGVNPITMSCVRFALSKPETG
ncbi:hypothetical protein FRC01_009563 [Tulasnella sp. 417]|nr:hypothetical protein FRC01_009563 [Tulasnella sp. 417]